MNALQAAYNKRVPFNYDVFETALRDIKRKTSDAAQGFRGFIDLGLPASAYAFTASGYDGHTLGPRGELAFSPWLLVSQVVAGANRIPARDLQVARYNFNLVYATMRAIGMPESAFFAAHVKVGPSGALVPDVAAAVRQLDAWTRSHPAPRKSSSPSPTSPNLPPPVTVTPSLPVPSSPQSPIPAGWAWVMGTGVLLYAFTRG